MDVWNLVCPCLRIAVSDHERQMHDIFRIVSDRDVDQLEGVLVVSSHRVKCIDS